jgi:regulatory protein
VIISRIQQQSHKRYDIFVDGETLLSIHEDILVKYGLHKGMEIELADLTELAEAEEYQRVSQAALHYLSYRARTVWEVTSHLLEKEYEKTLVQKAIEEMVHLGYLDDRKYATAWLAERQSNKKLGIIRIKQELKQKGISSTIIEEVIETEHVAEERQLVTEVAERRYSRLQNEAWPKVERRLGSYLLRRGFPSHLVRQALQQIRATHNQEE